MSKVCIIALANIRHISLISLYTEYLDAHQIPYDLIYIDRYGIEENTTASNTYAFRAAPARSRLGKLGSFLRFRRFALKRIRENGYDRIITWQTNTAYLFADVLLRRFPGKYVINVRDYIMENIPPVRLLLKPLVKKAAFVTISSAGFLEFLPQGQYVRVNSVNESLLQNARKGVPSGEGPYRIGFVGNCRFFSENYRLMEALANDPRFELWYCGTSSERLGQYAVEHGIHNVKCLPSFEPSETTALMERFHMINSAFGSDAMDNRTLMPIRLYTALELHIPVLVSEDTFLAEQVRTNHLGFVMGSTEALGDQLYAYLSGLDRAGFCECCDGYMTKARQENLVFRQRLGIYLGVDDQ